MLLKYAYGEVEEPVHFDVGVFKFTKSAILFSEVSDKDRDFSSFSESLFTDIDEKFSALITYDAASREVKMLEFVEQIYASLPFASTERAACSMVKSHSG